MGDFSELESELGGLGGRFSESVEGLKTCVEKGWTEACRADLDKDVRHDYSVMISKMGACMPVCDAVGKGRGRYEDIITKWSKEVGLLKKASSRLGVIFPPDTNQLEAGEVDDLIELAVCNLGDQGAMK